jgi:hypothetical protein
MNNLRVTSSFLANSRYMEVVKMIRDILARGGFRDCGIYTEGGHYCTEGYVSAKAFADPASLDKATELLNSCGIKTPNKKLKEGKFTVDFHVPLSMIQLHLPNLYEQACTLSMRDSGMQDISQEEKKKNGGYKLSADYLAETRVVAPANERKVEKPTTSSPEVSMASVQVDKPFDKKELDRVIHNNGLKAPGYPGRKPSDVLASRVINGLKVSEAEVLFREFGWTFRKSEPNADGNIIFRFLDKATVLSTAEPKAPKEEGDGRDEQNESTSLGEPSTPSGVSVSITTKKELDMVIKDRGLGAEGFSGRVPLGFFSTRLIKASELEVARDIFTGLGLDFEEVNPKSGRTDAVLFRFKSFPGQAGNLKKESSKPPIKEVGGSVKPKAEEADPVAGHERVARKEVPSVDGDTQKFIDELKTLIPMLKLIAELRPDMHKVLATKIAKRVTDSGKETLYMVRDGVIVTVGSEALAEIICNALWEE